MANPQGYSVAPGDADEIIKPVTLPTKFTKEEIAVLKECNTDSLLYRCIPLGVVFMAVTNSLVKVGYLSPHPKYGALLKNMAAIFCGYVVGKLSYQTTCRQKILTKIPDSRLALALKGNKNMQLTTENPVVEETHEDALQQGAPTYDLDTNRSSLETAYGLDDNFRPTVDREVRQKRVEEDKSFQFTSFDDLRYQNRMTFDKQSTQRDKPLENIPRRRPEPAKEPTENKKKNQYGDEWDE